MRIRCQIGKHETGENVTDIEFLEVNSKRDWCIKYVIRFEFRFLKGDVAVDGGVDWYLGTVI
jgi:hypothetical protein